jgi:hypothetical protein
LNLDLISYVLPSELLAYFNIVEVKELCDLKTKAIFLSVDLEEQNRLPNGYESSKYESKGFLSSKTVQDFPLRGKAVYLTIKRRRWRDKETKQEIRSDYSFIAEGSKLTQELSDFLKATGRDPRRHH